MFFLRIAKQKHLFYIIVAEKRLIFKAFSRCCGQHFYCVAINIPFSAVSPIQYTEGSNRAVEITLGGFFAARKNGKEVYVMVLKITPKQRTKINALVRKTCCNCYKGNCLLLDDLEMFG